MSTNNLCRGNCCAWHQEIHPRINCSAWHQKIHGDMLTCKILGNSYDDNCSKWLQTIHTDSTALHVNDIMTSDNQNKGNCSAWLQTIHTGEIFLYRDRLFNALHNLRLFIYLIHYFAPNLLHPNSMRPEGFPSLVAADINWHVIKQMISMPRRGHLDLNIWKSIAAFLGLDQRSVFKTKI
jgi:hypothetical protein